MRVKCVCEEKYYLAPFKAIVCLWTNIDVGWKETTRFECLYLSDAKIMRRANCTDTSDHRSQYVSISLVCASASANAIANEMFANCLALFSGRCGAPPLLAGSDRDCLWCRSCWRRRRRRQRAVKKDHKKLRDKIVYSFTVNRFTHIHLALRTTLHLHRQQQFTYDVDRRDQWLGTNRLSGWLPGLGWAELSNRLASFFFFKNWLTSFLIFRRCLQDFYWITRRLCSAHVYYFMRNLMLYFSDFFCFLLKSCMRSVNKLVLCLVQRYCDCCVCCWWCDTVCPIMQHFFE